MHVFDHLSIFVSIVIALGVTHLLSSLARLIHLRRHIKVYGPALVMAFSLLLLQIQIWWVSFYRRDILDWSFFGFALYLTIPATVSMLSYLAIPEPSEGGDMALDYNYNRKWFHALLGGAIAVSVIEDASRGGTYRFDANLIFRLVFLLLATAGFFADGRRSQWAASLSFLFTLIAYILILFSHL